MTNKDRALEEHARKRKWLKDPEAATKLSMWRKAYSTPIICDYRGHALKCTIVYHRHKDGTQVWIHSWKRKNTRPIRPAMKDEVDRIGIAPGTGWQAL